MYLRRSVGRGPWHLCANCTNWPRTSFEATTEEVSEDDVCKGCRRQVESGNCARHEQRE